LFGSCRFIGWCAYREDVLLTLHGVTEW
jgi:hypothetical protein